MTSRKQDLKGVKKRNAGKALQTCNRLNSCGLHMNHMYIIPSRFLPFRNSFTNVHLTSLIRLTNHQLTMILPIHGCDPCDDPARWSLNKWWPPICSWICIPLSRWCLYIVYICKCIIYIYINKTIYIYIRNPYMIMIGHFPVIKLDLTSF